MIKNPKQNAHPRIVVCTECVITFEYKGTTPVWKLVGCSAGSGFFTEFVTSTFSFVSFVTKVHLRDHN